MESVTPNNPALVAEYAASQRSGRIDGAGGIDGVALHRRRTGRVIAECDPVGLVEADCDNAD